MDTFVLVLVVIAGVILLIGMLVISIGMSSMAIETKNNKQLDVEKNMDSSS